jgi:hypothetical protein
MSDLPGLEQVLGAAQALVVAFGSEQPYAVVGGAACVVLGSTRLTVDVDVVVPKGQTRDARQLLRKSSDFVVQSRTNHTIFPSSPPVDVEIITPPAMFREPFDESTETIKVNGVRVLKPSLILNAKCGSIFGRATTSKKDTDAEDIRFLLNWCVDNRMDLTQSDVPNATKELVDAFIARYQGAELWRNAGYDLGLGMVSVYLITRSPLATHYLPLSLLSRHRADKTDPSIGSWMQG